MNTNTLLDSMLSVLVAAVPEHRWTLEGWANHLRPTRHAKHVANSHAKHAGEFGDAYEFALCLTLARCGDLGMGAEEARALVDERMAAREARAAA